MAAPPKWKPLMRAKIVQEVTEAHIDAALRGAPGMTREQARQTLEKEVRDCTYWINDLYQVQVRPIAATDTRPAMVHLNIRRRDGKPIFRDWRHFQQIKNELVGEECEAVELYPAESRLSDTSNKYHLFAIPDPSFRFPFGMMGRDILEPDETGARPGFRQRRFK